jgi:hypothetical protein
MASGLLPKSPVSLSLCDEVPHIFIPKSHLKPREFLISSAKRLLQQYLPLATDAPQQLALLFDHLVGQSHQLFGTSGRAFLPLRSTGKCDMARAP